MMLLLISVMLLCGGLSNGEDSIECQQCSQMTSSNPAFMPPSDPDAVSCDAPLTVNCSMPRACKANVVEQTYTHETVGAITCNMCMEMSSTNAVLQAGLAAAEGAGAEGTGAPMSMSCQTPVPMTCDKCMTQQFTFTFTSDTYGDGTLTMTQLGCSDPSLDSMLGADNCLSQEMVTMMANQISAGQESNLPPGITVTDTTGSLCVCDTDNCNVVPGAAASNPTGAAPSMMAGSAEPQAGDGAEQDTTMQTTTAGAVHVLASATVLIGSLLSAIVFRAV